MNILSIGRENFFWHKLHSLTGMFPIGYYLVQHLTLNSFSLGGPSYFNGVVSFFAGMPKHFFYAIELIFIWIPILFHAIYGLFITSRSMPNVTQKAFRYRENWMYTLQRISGLVAFAFLAYHMTATTIYAEIYGTHLIEYSSWQENLSRNGYLLLYVYIIGVVSSSYHFSYGMWNFCIRWGITIKERAQMTMFKVSTITFFALVITGSAALAGFFMHSEEPEMESQSELNTYEVFRTQESLFNLPTNFEFKPYFLDESSNS